MAEVIWVLTIFETQMVQSKADSVDEYLDELEPKRWAVIELLFRMPTVGGDRILAGEN